MSIVGRDLARLSILLLYKVKSCIPRLSTKLETVFFEEKMKFFLKLLVILNLAFANQGFSGRHRAHDDKGDHHGDYESYEHGSFHDHFAHALSVMRYYHQQRGKNSKFATLKI